VLRSNPGHLPSLLIAGAAEFSFGRLEIAERNMKQVLVTDPDNAFATELLAAIDERQARRARERSLAALIDDSSTPAAVAAAVDPATLNRQVLTVALDYLDRIRGVPKPAGETRARKAETHLREGRAAEAFRLVEPELVGQTASVDLLAIAAASSLLIGEANQARLVLRSLEDVAAESAEVQYLLAVAYRKLGDRTSYNDRLARSLAIDPGFLPAVGESARSMLDEMRLGQAETLLRVLDQGWQGRPEYYDLLGGLALLRGELGDAVDLYRQGFSAAPSTLRVLRLAYAEIRSGRSAESREVLENWLRDNPGDTAVALVLANKRLTSGEYVEAAELYSAVLRHVPDHIVAINNLAWVSLRLGNNDVALRLARQGFDLAPEDPRLMDTLAEILMSAQKFDEALPLLKRAFQRDRSNPGLQVRLAQVLAQTGNPTEAGELLQQVLDAHPDFPERPEAERLSAQLEK
jgi:tetratricopeptide (TPR) repeat protein